MGEESCVISFTQPTRGSLLKHLHH